MSKIVLCLVVVTLNSVLSKPLDNLITNEVPQVDLQGSAEPHSLSKRFINPEFTIGSGFEAGLNKMRTKRYAVEDCEKLQLCKLHSRSSRNFFAAFELYFVNKENARLWDHHAHSIAECEQKFYC